MTTQALAEHFQVSERTIGRDITRLQDLNIEVETLPGRKGGVRLRQGSLLQTLRFTDDELLVLALGLKQGRQVSDPHLAKAATSAFKRLRNTLTEQQEERLEAALHTGTPEAGSEWNAGRLPSRIFLDVAEAVQQRSRLEVRYRSHTSGFTYRTLDPYGVVHVSNHWYVTGYCHLRQDVRTFRLDRLELLEVTAAQFKPPDGFDPFATVSKSLAQAPFPDNLTCRVWLDTTLEEASKHVPAYIGMFEASNNGVMFTALSRLDWLGEVALYLMDFPFEVQVLEPPALRESLEKVAKRAEKLSRGASA